jgi:hypothetical protein
MKIRYVQSCKTEFEKNQICYSVMLSSRTRKLTKNQRQAIFALASDDLISRFPENLLAGNAA